MVLHGSESVVLWSKDNLYIIKTLREFQYVDDEGRDQGASIRAKAKALTSLLLDDDSLRRERLAQKGKTRRRTDFPVDDELTGSGSNRRRNSATRANGRGRSRTGPSSNENDDELQRALEESRLSAADDEKRRQNRDSDDDDLRKAIMLSKEEEQHRYIDNERDLFAPATTAEQENLIDISTQPAQPLQMQYTTQPIYVQQQQQPQVDLFGSAVYQQPLSTGYVQNIYATGQDYTGFPQQSQLGYQPQQQFLPQQQPQPESLQPLKTGSNNPFAQITANSNTPSFGSQSASLDQIQYQYQQQQQQQQEQQQLQQQQQLLMQQQQQHQSLFSQPQSQSQPAPQKPAFTGQTSSHLDELNNMIATGEGLDTYGNTGDVRIPAQHTQSTFINSQGTGAPKNAKNPFMGQHYTGVVTTNPIQPAFTGYGFGNAQQSQQAYQQSFQPQQQNTNRPNQSLIDI